MLQLFCEPWISHLFAVIICCKRQTLPFLNTSYQMWLHESIQRQMSSNPIATPLLKIRVNLLTFALIKLETIYSLTNSATLHLSVLNRKMHTVFRFYMSFSK